MEKFQLSRILGPLKASAIQVLTGLQGSVRMKTILAVTVATTVAATSFVNASIQAKEVTLVVGGEQQKVSTYVDTVAQLLNQQSISIAQSDYVSHDLAAKLADGQKIIIRKPISIQFKLGNQTQIVDTTASDVKSFLAALQIEANEAGSVTPALDTPIQANMVIQLNDVKTVVVEEKQQLAFDTITKRDSNLVKGKQRVLQSGHAGEVITKVEKQYYKGKLISVKQVSTTETKKAKNRILAIGTAKPVAVLSASTPAVDEVSRRGIDFDVKRVLKNVELSAYDAGFTSTGKVKGQAGYGRTATGSTVTQGRTIAVDPNVIPLGWWVYIEGIGFRRAEDKGSAIKGNKIDIYFDSHNAALSFGRQYGYTVYVIGPEKP